MDKISSHALEKINQGIEWVSRQDELAMRNDIFGEMNKCNICGDELIKLDANDHVCDFNKVSKVKPLSLNSA